MGVCVGHEPCPRCGSKDNLARYEDGGASCFTPDCTYYESSGEVRTVTKSIPTNIKYDGDFLVLGNRGIDINQVKKYGVKTTEKGTVTFPYKDTNGDLVATKLRSTSKKFMYTGDKEKLELFGQHLFGVSDKFANTLTITEGEFDAMAVRQMLGEYPVVSIHSSTTADRDVKNNIEFIESFDKVVLCLDNDEAGRKATQTISELLSPNKVFIATMTDFKDANEYLIKGAVDKFKKSWWNPKKYSPAGVVTLSSGFDKYRERLNTRIIEIPDYWGEAKKMLNGGFAVGEITTITADTSVGKTTHLVNLIEGILKLDPTRNITALMLETTVGEIVKFVCKREFGVDIDVGDEHTEEQLNELEGMFNTLEWVSRLHVIEHVGSLSSTEEIVRKLRSTAVSSGSDLIIVDPLQQAVPSIDHDVVRGFMDELLKLSQNQHLAAVVTSHIKNRQKKDPYDITEDDAIGSSAIKQVTWTQILLARDKMASDINVKNATKVSIPKCRRTGNTGVAGWMQFDNFTGGFTAIPNPITSDGVNVEEEFSV